MKKTNFILAVLLIVICSISVIGKNDDIPIIDSFTPKIGIKGDVITIIGSNFNDTTDVKFNGIPTTFTIKSSTIIIANVPATATTGKISVTNKSKTGNSTDDFTINIRPSNNAYAVIKDPTSSVSVYDNVLIEETKNYFISKGFSIIDNKDTADFIVVTSISTSKVGGNFNPVGCLVCGIFGAIQNKATINIKTIIHQNKAQIWNNTASASTSGEFLFGLFEDTAPLVKQTIKKGVSELFKTYNKPQ